MIVFQDVDGCLNTPDGAALDIATCILTEQQRFALKEFGELLDSSAVTHLVVNTGRSWQATKFICEAINSTKVRYVLTEHGSELWDLKTNTALDLMMISEALGLVTIRAALKSVRHVRDLMLWFQTTGNSLVCADMGYPGLISCLDDKTSNLTLRIPSEVDGDSLLSALQASILNEENFAGVEFVFHHNRADGFIDVMGEIDKGMGVELVTRYLGGSYAETFAIGDGLNDLPMFHAVNYPICPANAMVAVQDLCKARGYRSDASYIAAVTTWLTGLDRPNLIVD
jgi:hydroxymethylpyrimidine pyrophosphatase-like HAD family hydrolase